MSPCAATGGWTSSWMTPTASSLMTGEPIVQWQTPPAPIASIGPDGLATAGIVCQDTVGVVTGSYLGVSGWVSILVLDSDPDNYGLYAGDQENVHFRIVKQNEIIGVSNQPPDRVVCFRPASTGRLYRLLYATNLVSGVWTNLPGATPVSGVGGPMSLNDTNVAPVRFYRVHVQAP